MQFSRAIPQERRTKRLGLALTETERKAVRWAARKAKLTQGKKTNDSLVLWHKTVSECVAEYVEWLDSRKAVA